MNLIVGLKAAFSFLSSVFIVISVCFLGRFQQIAISLSTSTTHLLFVFVFVFLSRLVLGVQVVSASLQSRA